LLNEERKQFDEKLKLLEETKEQLKLEFENLSNSILTDNSKKFTEQNKLLLENVLSPFKNQITDFKKKIEEIYIDETKERSSLKNEIENLRKLNEQISLEAENLTNALKKDVKSQGDWGEIKLEMVLEASGLTKGLEYEVQLNLKDDEGDNFRPDVVVHLPDKRDIVIDSKVSLTAYERYVSAETKEEKIIAMKEHINSLRKHIRELSDKNYHKLYGINSLDFVLMFVYNEASYIAAIDFDKELLKEAFNKKILIVAPLTLYGTLKIINSLWKFDEQNKNAREIADKASKLYDKFVGFTDTFSDLGNSIQKVNSQYNNALKKLSEGRGNLISQAEKLKDLGVVTKKDLPDNMDKLLLPENKNGN
jgi:DNA recombination protein RmuC